MNINLRIVLGWSLLLWGVIINLFSVFAASMTTKITIMLIGTLLFMIGDVILLIDAALKGE